MLGERFVKHKFNERKQDMKFGIEHRICLLDAWIVWPFSEFYGITDSV